MPLRFISYLTRRQTRPFRIVSRTDQRPIVLYLHLERLSAHAIHDDLVAILSPKALAYSTVTRYLGEAKLRTAEVPLDPELSSPRLDSMIPTRLSCQPWKRGKTVFIHARTYPSHPYPMCYRVCTTHKIARVHIMSSSLGAATFVRSSEGEAC
jgi:hypothetical protein